MSRGDGTGPFGQGPMTGRAAGYCAGQPGPGYAFPGGGAGFGRGRGGGRFGRRNWFRATGLPGWLRFGAPWGGAGPAEPEFSTDEMAALRRQAGLLEEALSGIRKRIDALETKQGKSE